MMSIVDLVGKRFGYLTITKFKGRQGLLKTMWQCRCDCGKVLIKSGKLIKTNLTGCGCKKSKPPSWRHGYVGSREYSAWKAMKRRCYSKHYRSYKFYGARGITVCKRWREDFTNFIQDMGRCPGEGYEVDRKDPRKNYTPANTQWLTKTENGKKAIKDAKHRRL